MIWVICIINFDIVIIIRIRCNASTTYYYYYYVDNNDHDLYTNYKSNHFKQSIIKNRVYSKTLLYIMVSSVTISDSMEVYEKRIRWGHYKYKDY